MGDYADCITKDDKRFDIEGLAKWVKRDNIVESQREFVCDLFSPIREKCLAMLTGNHEESIHIHYQNDFTRNVCKDLGTRYGGYSAFIVPSFQRTDTSNRQYIIHAWHGSGASQTEGARMMRLMRLVNEINAHIYLMGHLHSITMYCPERLIYFRNKIKSVRLVSAITGAWCKTYSQGESSISYAEQKGYKPARIGCPIVHINPDDDQFSIEA